MKELKATEGMYLTQNKDVEDRIFITAIKGENINESDWREATEEEKLAYEESLNQENLENPENTEKPEITNI